MLTPAQRTFWEDNGYLVLRSVLRPCEIAEVLHVVNDQWHNRAENNHVVDILSGPEGGTHVSLRDARPDHRNNVYKLNNLFLNIPQIRKIAYLPVIYNALTELLEGDPLICNSLNFERGSQQPFHFDTWYMPPPVDGKMVAANIALEAMDSENGPFTYYPGSHKIPPWRFSNGRLNFNQDEAAAMYDYIDTEIQKRGLKAETFHCQGGDVFLWHNYLYHGGAPITDPTRTRNSLVVHYWRAGDLPEEKVRGDVNGKYLRHTLRGELQPVP